MSVCPDFPAVSVSTYSINAGKGCAPESRMIFPHVQVMGECKNTLWAAGKMFRYQQQNFLSLKNNEIFRLVAKIIRLVLHGLRAL
jgi:hypothetical protein